VVKFHGVSHENKRQSHDIHNNITEPPGKPGRSALYSGLFGHKSSKITEIYIHISNKNLSKIRKPLESIVEENR